MNPNSIPKKVSRWVLSCVASVCVASSAYGQSGPPAIYPVTAAGVQTDTSAIVITDNSVANPFPSRMLVTNYVGTVGRATVTITGIGHLYPDDIDIVLESPSGDKVILMSDVGGQSDLDNVNLTFDQSSSGQLPNEAQILSGTYQPRDVNSGADDFVGGTPAGPFLTSLDAFTDEVPNGIWRLYVSDDSAPDGGSIRSWTLNLAMRPIMTLTNAVVSGVPQGTTAEDTAVTFSFLVNDSDNLESITLSSTSVDANFISGVTFGGSGTNRTVTITPKSNATNTTGTVFTIRATDGSGLTVENQLRLIITPANDAPTLSLSATSASIPQAGISDVIAAIANDVDLVDADRTGLTLVAYSSNPSVVSTNNVLITIGGAGTPGTNSVRIAAGATLGSATITIAAVDASGATNSAVQTIDVTVTDIAQPVFGNPESITITDNAAGTPYPSTVNVSNVVGAVGRVVVSLIDVHHTNPDDIGVLLLSPDNRAVVLMRGAGGGTDIQDVRLTFSADAAGAISDSAALTTSTNQSADYSSGNFAGPAPAGPYPSDLASLQGASPNGQWRLFVYDTTAPDSGAIRAGWVMTVFPAPTIAAIPTQNLSEGSTASPDGFVPLEAALVNSITVNFAVGDEDGAVTNITAALVSPQPATNTSTVVVTVDNPSVTGNAGSLRVSTVADLSGTNQIRVIATDNTGKFTATNVFNVVVAPRNDPPIQEVIPRLTTFSGRAVSSPDFTVGDKVDETPAANLVVQVSSDNSKLLPPGSVVVTNIDAATRRLTFFPVGSGVANVTVRVTDGGGAFSEQTFELNVTGPANPFFENFAQTIEIRDGTNAIPTPSTITVSNVVGTIAEVQVTLYGLTHPNPDDLDIMLVSPRGTNVVVMSDVGGATTGLSNVVLTIRDSASLSFPDDGQIYSGAYKPTDVGSGDFPYVTAPASNASTLSANTNSDPNGTWSLYIRDDSTSERGGVLTGWQLSIRTRPQLAAIPDQTTTEDRTHTFRALVGDAQPGVPYTVVAAESQAPSGRDIISSIVTEVVDNNLTVTIAPIADQNGTNTVTLTVSDPDGFEQERSFLFIVTPVNDNPTISNIANTSTPAATQITIPFTVNDAILETPAGNITVSATSSDESIIPNSAISLGGSGSARTITISPPGFRPGLTTISITARDQDAPSNSSSVETFELNVTRSVGGANTAAITINPFAAGTPYPSPIDVSGVNGLISGAQVILDGFGHTFPDDVDVLLVSPRGQKILLMSDAGGGTAVSNLRLTFETGGAALPNGGTLTSGTFAPTDFTDVPGDSFPAPAPASPYSTSLDSLLLQDPNGTWNLYVVDDTTAQGGSVARGWILILDVAPTITNPGTQTLTEDTAAEVRFSVGDADSQANQLEVLASITDTAPFHPGLLVPSNLTLTTNGFDYVLRILPSTNRPAGTTPETNRVTLSVTDETGAGTNTSFLVVVQPENDAPVVTTATNRVITTEDTPITINFAVRDVDSVLRTNDVTITSSNTGLVPGGAPSITLASDATIPAGDTGTIAVTVRPNGNVNGTTVLTFTIRDQNGSGRSATTDVTLEVTPVNDAPSITAIANISVPAGTNSQVVPFIVGDQADETPAANLVVTATSSDQTVVPNGNITLRGSGTERTIQVTALNRTGTATITVNVADTGTPALSSQRQFTVTVTPSPTSVYANTGRIVIRDANTADIYPSVISVGATTGVVHSITVTLDGLSHAAPDDVDVLLVSPTGRAVRLMSDAGGGNAITGLRLTFSDSGASLPDDSPITSGIFRPTNYGGVEGANDPFPAPAPVGPYTNSALSTFHGQSPTGDWRLFVVDDRTGEVGEITFGWALSIVTTPTVTIDTASYSNGTFERFNEDGSGEVSFIINDPIIGTTPELLLISLVSDNRGLINPDNVRLDRSGGNTVVAQIPSEPDQFGTNNLTVIVSRQDPGGLVSATNVILIDVVAVPDVPVLSNPGNQTTPEDVTKSFDVTLVDGDTPRANLRLRLATDNEGLLSVTNVTMAGIRTNLLNNPPEGPISITLQPAANASGTAQITLTAAELNGNVEVNPTTRVITFTVNAVNDQPVITFPAPGPQGTVEAGGSTTNIVFTVSDVENQNVTVTGSSSDTNLIRNSDIVIAPAGGAPGSRTITITARPSVQGTNLITMVALDAGGASNTVSFEISVRPTRERTTNQLELIVINDSPNTATPYPSRNVVSGFVGNISEVTLTLNGFQHNFPSDVDVLLVSPAGKKVLVMSDAGGGNSVAGLNLRIDQDAANPIPETGPLVTGIYRPANYDSIPDTFPAPAPAGPYATSLTAFNGDSPNGEWTLYVVDDTPPDSGRITNGWTLGITTTPLVTVAPESVTKSENDTRPLFATLTVIEESFAGTNFTFTVASTNTAIVPTANVTFERVDATTFGITVNPTANASGESLLTISVRNADGQVVSDTLKVVVTSENDAPVITQQIPDVTLTAGGTTNMVNAFNYSDEETDKVNLTVTVQSSNPSVIPASNVVIAGNDVRVSTFGGASGAVEIAVTVSDGSSSATDIFVVTVLASPTPLFASSEPITIPASGQGTPYPSIINVSNVAGTVTRVVVTLSDVSHPFPDDLDVLLVGPGGQRVVLVSDAGGSGRLTLARLTVQDGAPAFPNDTAINPAGTYSPSNYDASADNFPIIGSIPAGNTPLSLLNGSDPNGAWSLYVVDDSPPDGGSIGGWLLNIETTAPSITQLTDVTLPERSSLVVPFEVNSGDVNPSNLVVRATMEGTPFSTLALGGDGTARTLIITSGNQPGTNQVTLTVTDGTNSASTTFDVGVIDVDNDPPTIGTIGDVEVDVGTASVVIDLQVTDPDNAISELTFFSGTTGTNIVSSVLFALTTNNTVTATINIVPNAVGQETVTISVTDGENIDREDFLVTVGGSGNRRPVIEPIADVTTNEDVGVTVPLTISDAETALGQLTITGSASNPSLVSGVTIQNNGTAVTAGISLVSNASGTSTITISANDGTNTATRAFSLVVIPQPDPPSLAPIANQNVATGTTTVNVPLTVSDPDNALTDLTFFSSHSGTNIQSITFDVTATTATAVLTLNANADGSEQVTITVSDGEEISRQTFTLSVGSVLTEPATLSISRTGTNITILVDGTAGAVYSLQSSTNLPSSWIQIRLIKIEGDGVNEVTLPIPASGALRPYQFFRAVGAQSTDVISDVTSPGDAIVLVNGTNDGDTAAGAPPAAEGVERSIDNTPQKYLNFLDNGSGFAVTPSVGSTVVTGLRLWPANDAIERDPASYRLEGSTTGADGTYTLISEGAASLATNRNSGGTAVYVGGTNFQEIAFPNTAAYTTYRVTFPTLRNAGTANSMQIAEVDLIGRTGN